MQFPTTVEGLVYALIGDVVFLGACASLLTAGLITLLQSKWALGDNWKRAIAIAVAEALVALAYAFGIFRNFFAYSDDGLYNAIVVGVKGGMVAAASLLAYTAYRGVKVAVNRGRGVENKPGE
jgi:hypothetical protein